MSENYDHLLELMFAGDDEALNEAVLLESEKDDIIHALDGETTLMNYLMLFEEFLEDHDIYLFSGWDKAQIIGRPTVKKFWIIFHLLVNDNTDLGGARRVRDAMGQGKVIAKRIDDGNVVVRFEVLKRDLDKIEEINKEKIEELSDQAMGEL